MLPKKISGLHLSQTKMDKLINVFKAKGFDDEESKLLAEYAIKLSESLCIPIEQAQADAFAILSMAMAE